MREILGWMEVLSPASNSFIKSNKLDRYAPAITVFFINKMEERGRGRRGRRGRRKTETTFPFQVWRRFFEASKKRKGGSVEGNEDCIYGSSLKAKKNDGGAV